MAHSYNLSYLRGRDHLQNKPSKLGASGSQLYCNPSYSRGRDREDRGSRAAWAKSETYLKNT
jgi:hypothetical protein